MTVNVIAEGSRQPWQNENKLVLLRHPVAKTFSHVQANLGKTRSVEFTDKLTTAFSNIWIRDFELKLRYARFLFLSVF